MRIIISGSTKGIGRETARLFLQQGAHLVIHGRDKAMLEQLKNEFPSDRIQCIRGDLVDPKVAESMIQVAQEAFGGIDALINNAAISMRGDFIDLTQEVVRQVFEVNTLSAINLTRLAFPHLLAAQGSLVFVSSISGICGFPGASVYSASKMALTAMAQAIDAEYRHTGLHVGTVYLPYVENDEEKTVLTATGETLRYQRKFTYTQETAAQTIQKLIEKQRRRLIVTPSGKFAWGVQGCCPPLADFILRRSRGKIHRIKTQA